MYAYLDDILIVTKGPKDVHKNTLRQVLKNFNEENLAISIEKWIFARKQIECLGYKKDSEGTTPLIRTEAIERLSPPTTFKQLKSFMGSIHHLTR